jgi:hypothetical protein
MRHCANLNDKRSRYIPASHSLVLQCPEAWFDELVPVQKGGEMPRWEAAASIDQTPGARSIPIRFLRVLYALPNPTYEKWVPSHTPTGSEYFCPQSSLDSYRSQKMQTFLRQMSVASQFYIWP